MKALLLIFIGLVFLAGGAVAIAHGLVRKDLIGFSFAAFGFAALYFGYVLCALGHEVDVEGFIKAKVTK